MEPTDSGPGTNPAYLEQSSILYGLPDDIAILCLARIPRKYHANLKCVSKRWRELVCSQEWHSYRQKHNLAETWIYALCRDKTENLSFYMLDPNMSKKGWKRVQNLPPRSLKRKGMGFEVLGRKIYLMGGCGWIEDATDEVYCYDAAMNTWNEAPSLSTARYGSLFFSLVFFYYIYKFAYGLIIHLYWIEYIMFMCLLISLLTIFCLL